MIQLHVVIYTAKIVGNCRQEGIRLLRNTAVVLAFIIAFSCVPALSAGPYEPAADFPAASGGLSYASLGSPGADQIPDDEIDIPIHFFTDTSGVTVLDDYLERQGPILAMNDGYITFSVNIPKDGRYWLMLSYAAMCR